MKGLRVFDLRTVRPDGTYWDLGKLSHQREALRLIEQDDPDWIMWAALHGILTPQSCSKLSKDERRSRGSKGFRRAYPFKICMQIVPPTGQTGKFFLHEHPRTARSWDQAVVKRVLDLPGVGATVCDQCAFGLVTPDENGTMTPALKPTMFMSNSPIMLRELTRRCDGTHSHQPLLGCRASAAENYSMDLVIAMVRGMAKTNQARAIMKENGTDDWNNIFSMTACNSTTTTTKHPPDSPVTVPAPCLPTNNGTSIHIDFDDSNFRQTYRDEYTGEIIPYDLVKKAMAEE